MGYQVMGNTVDLKGLANSILDSYEMRVETVNALIKQAFGFLGSFRIELEDMIMRLRDNLAGAETLRNKDFDCMMDEVVGWRRENEEEATLSLGLFQEQESEMIGRLRKVIDAGSRAEPADVEAVKEDIVKRQAEREKTIVKALKRFHLEQEGLRAGLNMLLERGDSVRIRDLRAMLKTLRVRKGDPDTELGRILDQLEETREMVHARWQTLEPGR